MWLQDKTGHIRQEGSWSPDHHHHITIMDFPPLLPPPCNLFNESPSFPLLQNLKQESSGKKEFCRFTNTLQGGSFRFPEREVIKLPATICSFFFFQRIKL